MNRLCQLSETLLKNIEDNAGYENIEFVLLNYNSQDGMEEWVKENMSEFISSGRLVYYKTIQPQSFSHSHSKNLAFNLATGHIVCNINADHFTGTDFANYVNREFSDCENIVLTPIDFPRARRGFRPAKDVFGKVCVLKKSFEQVKGFDERMKGYGFEDFDFVNRLELSGVKRRLIDDFAFLKYISHSEESRYDLKEEMINSIYVHYVSSSKTEFLFLDAQQRFKRFLVADNFGEGSANYDNAYRTRDIKFETTIMRPGIEEGVWREDSADVYLNFDSGRSDVLCKRDFGLLRDKGKIKFYRLSDAKLVKEIINSSYFIPNRYIMERNLVRKLVRANPNRFGAGVVFKNFLESPIDVA